MSSRRSCHGCEPAALRPRDRGRPGCRQPARGCRRARRPAPRAPSTGCSGGSWSASCGSGSGPGSGGGPTCRPTGPAIIAPVHRSNVDFAFAARRSPAASSSSWPRRSCGRPPGSVGCSNRSGSFPVRRSGTDRESVRRAEEVLLSGELLVMFPEGARRLGDHVEDLQEGVAFLAARTGAPIVPIGIFGSERAMPKGAKFPKPIGVTLSIGEPLLEPAPREAGRRVAPEPDPPADRGAAGAPPGGLRRRGAVGEAAGALAPPGAHDDRRVAEAEEEVRALLGRPRGAGPPHRRALGHPPAPRDGRDEQLGGLVLALPSRSTTSASTSVRSAR